MDNDLYDVVPAATYLSFQLLDLILSLLCSHNQLGKPNREYKMQNYSANLTTPDAQQT